ncbi:hypothetical protein NE852_23515 [Rhizobium sp. Pop5]|uniref:hypothetical protein n=1 Tax=Rhizobium sp. Pop5 TaxID=1223565 RepID=UPI000FFB56E0|nr:hypothetical protein [Rhizobium sp. Pop5]UVD56976.1 hypothetical protein NE852_23515 [Rhizobium sp. Pop5]
MIWWRPLQAALRGGCLHLAEVDVESQVEPADPKFVIAVLVTVVKEAIENALLFHLKIYLKPLCLLKETHSRVQSARIRRDLFVVAKRSGQNDTVRLRLTSPVNMGNGVIFQILIHG